MYKSRNSVYCYKNTDVLINELDIKDTSILEILERKLISLKLLELNKLGITGEFDTKHFINIHKFLFEDIYPFAGALRIENIAKDNFKFAEWQYIENELQKILDNLKEEEYLINTDKQMLTKKLAYYMAELNVLHPFREGNGRVIREFIRQLALRNNYILDLRVIKPNEILSASIKSLVDTSELENIIFKCLSKI